MFRQGSSETQPPHYFNPLATANTLRLQARDREVLAMSRCSALLPCYKSCSRGPYLQYVLVEEAVSHARVTILGRGRRGMDGKCGLPYVEGDASLFSGTPTWMKIQLILSSE